VERDDVLRLEAQHLREIIDRFAVAAEPRLELCAALPGRSVPRLEPYRLVQVGERRFDVAQAPAADAAVQIRLRSPSGADRLAMPLDRLADLRGARKRGGAAAGIEALRERGRAEQPQAEARGEPYSAWPQVFSQSLPRKSVSRPSRS
jgi:hypothetical protein